MSDFSLRQLWLAASVSLLLTSCQQALTTPTALPTQPQLTITTPTPLALQGQLQRKGQQLELHISLDEPFQTQALNCSIISHFEVQITGLGIPEPILPNEANSEGWVEGAGSCNPTAVITFSNVPVGKGRVVEIQALNDGMPMKGAHVALAFDVTSAPMDSLSVNHRSRPAALVVKYFLAQAGLQGGHLLHHLNLQTLQEKIDLITGFTGSTHSLHPLFVNTDAVAQALLSKGANAGELDPDNSAFVSAGGSISGILAGKSNLNYALSLQDPLSPPSPMLVSSGPFEIPNVPPGEWNLSVTEPSTSRFRTFPITHQSTNLLLDMLIPDWQPSWWIEPDPLPNLSAVTDLAVNATNLFIATANSGIQRYSIPGEQWTPLNGGPQNIQRLLLHSPTPQLEEHQLYALHSEGVVIWSNIYEASPVNSGQLTLSEHLNEPVYTDLALHNDILWLATGEDGVYCRSLGQIIEQPGGPPPTEPELPCFAQAAFSLLSPQTSEPVLFVGGEGQVSFTADGGSSWQEIPGPAEQRITQMSVNYTADNNFLLYALGQQGNQNSLWRYERSSNQWQNIGASLPQPLSVLSLPDYPDHVLVGLEAGGILSSANARTNAPNWQAFHEGAVSNLPNSSPVRLLSDYRQGNLCQLWAVTQSNGILKSEIGQPGCAVEG